MAVIDYTYAMNRHPESLGEQRLSGELVLKKQIRSWTF